MHNSLCSFIRSPAKVIRFKCVKPNPPPLCRSLCQWDPFRTSVCSKNGKEVLNISVAFVQSCLSFCLSVCQQASVSFRRQSHLPQSFLIISRLRTFWKRKSQHEGERACVHACVVSIRTHISVSVECCSPILIFFSNSVCCTNKTGVYTSSKL